MKKLILFGLLYSILLVGSVQADPDLGYFCIDGNSYYNWTLDSDVYDIEKPCAHGCNEDNGLCYNEESGTDLAFAMIFIWFAIAIITMYLAMNIDGKVHGLLTVFFMILSLYSIWNMLGSASASAQLMNVDVFDPILNANISIWVWVIIFVLFYILIFFIVFYFNVLRNLINKRRVRKKGELMADSFGISNK